MTSKASHEKSRAKKPAKPKAIVESKQSPTIVSEDVLVLRSCKADLTSYGGFQWPESGIVEAPDWSSTPECGNGLHGWLWGVGDYSLKVKDFDARYLVVKVDKSTIVQLNNKVKFPRGQVVMVGTWADCFWHVRTNAPKDELQKSATGNYGHASATGEYGHASATGEYGHASATGNSGHASATGEYGHASATGEYGHASATGDYGHASATGDYGAACVLGQEGKARASANGSVILTRWDGKRFRHVIGYVGEDGIKADTWYHLENGSLAEIKE